MKVACAASRAGSHFQQAQNTQTAQLLQAAGWTFRQERTRQGLQLAQRRRGPSPRVLLGGWEG